MRHMYSTASVVCNGSIDNADRIAMDYADAMVGVVYDGVLRDGISIRMSYHYAIETICYDVIRNHVIIT
jgi:hypothetical protein